MLTLIVSAFMIVLLNPSVAGVGTFALGTSLEPLLDGFRAIVRRPIGGVILGIIALVGLIASFHTILYAQGRQIYSLSRAGYFPSALSVTHATHKTPHVAMITGSLVGFVVMLIIWYRQRRRRPGPTQLGDDIIGTVMLNMAVFGAMLSYIAQAASFILLRRNQPNIERPYRSPLGIPGAVVTIVIALVTLFYQVQDPELLPRGDLGDRLVRRRHRLFRARGPPQAHPLARGRVRAGAQGEVSSYRRIHRGRGDCPRPSSFVRSSPWPIRSTR